MFDYYYQSINENYHLQVIFLDFFKPIFIRQVKKLKMVLK
jgi:hypothetical protein